MTRFPQFLRSRLALRQAPVDAHLAADTLAAFVEQTLPARARADVLEHLARCTECREILAAAATPVVAHTPGIDWWKWRWAGAAAAACLVAALFWRPGSFENTPAQKVLSAPSAPSAPQKQAEPKAAAPTPPIASTYRRPAPSPKQQPTAEAKPEQTLPQTVILPQPKLNLTLAAPRSPLTETTSLQIAEATNDFPQLAGRGQSEKRPQNRTGIVERNRLFEFGVRANAAKSRTHPTLRPEGEKSLWTLDGTLRKSDDGGRTWSTVQFDGQARLYALSAAGADVWVGGADGLLMHSVDNGLHWKPIVVANAGARLTGTITRIEVRDENWVRVKTRSGDWLTTDAGLHWQRQ